MAWNEGKALEAALSFQKGEQKGFEFFFNSLYAPLRYHAYKILKDDFWMDDIIESSFIKLWDNRGTLNNPKVISAWLYTTVKNESLHKIQGVVLREKNENKYYESRDLLTHETDYDLIKTEVHRKLYESVNSLPQACGRILKLLFFDGLTVSEICTKLKLSSSCIKTQKARGLMLLRKKYNVSIESVRQKQERWIRSVYLNCITDKSFTHKLYGIDSNTIMSIRNGRTWKHITETL